MPTVSTLSGGEKRRVALCRLLLDEPDLLLLDEPTNHLDAETVGWLEKHLELFPGAVLIVTHDRYFLDHVTGWILELDRGRGIPYEGNYTAYLEKKAKRLHQESREDAARQKVIEREREWMGRWPEARRAKSKARIKAYDELLKANEARLQSRDAQIVIPPGPRLGDMVIEADQLSKGFGGTAPHRRPLLQAAARRHRRHHRPERRRQDHARAHADRRGEARRRRRSASARPPSSAMSTRAARSIPTRTSGREYPAARR